MLTPLDIQKQDFAVKFRGYDDNEVDDFLDLVGADYEKLYRENRELKEKITFLQKSVDEYKEMEVSLRNAMICAQNTAEDMKKNASEKAQNIPQEAETVKLEKSQELAKIKSDVETYKTKIKGLCTTLLEILETME